MTTITTQDTDQQIHMALQAVAGRPSITHVYYVACGGSLAIMNPNKYVLDRESEMNAEVLNSNEFIHRNPRSLGDTSVVILVSHRGNTPETVKAAEFARSRGALTIALTHIPGSPLDLAAEHSVYYQYTPTSQNFDSSHAVLFRLTFGLMKIREQYPHYAALKNSLQALPAVVERVQREHAADIQAFGTQYKREPVIYTMASGANYGVAYSFAICLLQEMQWIHSQAIHAGEYFHGPFEITDYDVPFIVLLGLDETRPLEERALRFVTKYSEKVVVLDASKFDLTGLDSEVARYLVPLIFQPLLRLYAEELGAQRGHPLSVRRYMWKMEY